MISNTEVATIIRHAVAEGRGWEQDLIKAIEVSNRHQRVLDLRNLWVKCEFDATTMYHAIT